MEPQFNNISEKVTAIAAPLAASLGLAIWGVEVVPAGRTVIRVYAESLTGEGSLPGSEAEASGDNQIFNAETRPDTCDACVAGEPVPCETASCDEAEGDDAEVDDPAPYDGNVSQGGISIGQCAELSRLLGLSLEVEDCIEMAYVLEVSSPGLNRLFFTPEQVARSVGQKAEVTLASPVPLFPGRKKFVGIVQRVEGEVVFLAVAEPEDGEVAIPWPQVKKMRQIYVPPEKILPGKSAKNTRRKKGAGKKKN